MFNFAIAGRLERYEPLQRQPSVQPVGRVRSAAEVGSIRAGTEGEKFEIPGEGPFPTSKPSPALKGYSSNAATSEPQQRHRAWIVSDLMTSSVRTLRAEDEAAEAVKLVENAGFRHIPIVNDLNQVVGLVSDRDLLRASELLRKRSTSPISSIMTERVLTCFPETSLRLAAQTMLNESFSSLPVVDPQGVLVGILTTSDILKALVNEAPLDLWA